MPLLPPMGAGRGRVQGLSIVSHMSKSRRSDPRDTAETDKIGYDVSNMESGVFGIAAGQPVQHPKRTVPQQPMGERNHR